MDVKIVCLFTYLIVADGVNAKWDDGSILYGYCTTVELLYDENS